MGTPPRNTRRGSEVLRRKQNKMERLRALFERMQQPDPPSIAEGAKQFELPYDFAQKRWKRWRDAAAAGDEAKKAAVLEHRSGGHNRAFKPEEEAKLVESLKLGFTVLTRSTLRPAVLTFHEHTRRAQGRHRYLRSSPLKAPFSASGGFLSPFLRRNGLSCKATKLVPYSKKPSDTSNRAAEEQEFRQKVRAAIEKYGASMVLNMDEVPVIVIERPMRALGVRGDNEYARIPTAFTSRSYLTTLPCISAAGHRLQLAALIAGKTTRTLRKIRLFASNDVQRVRLFHTEKGKTTTQSMLDWMQGPLLNYTQGRPAALLLDAFRAHWTKKVQDLAILLNVELICVPPGLTAELQPLDVNFNGPWKAMREQIWIQKRCQNPFFSDSWQAAVERASAAYKAIAISEQQTKSAWKKAGLI